MGSTMKIQGKTGGTNSLAWQRSYNQFEFLLSSDRVSTFEPSEEEERMVTRENCLTLKDESESGDLDIVPTCSYLFDDQGFVLVYIEAKSAHIIDGKGNTSTDEISCYGVWFGQGNPK